MEDLYYSVEISPNGIFELDNSQRIVSAPRESIVMVELCKAVDSQRPLIQLIVGIGFFLIGVNACRGVLHWFIYGGTLYIDVALVLIIGIPIGAWLIYGAIRKKVLLLITMKKGKKRVVFKGKYDIETARNFVSTLCKKYGYVYKIHL